MSNLDCHFHKLFILYWDERVIVRYCFGTKKDLYSYVGYIYSNSIEVITRVDYKDVESVPQDTVFFTVNDNGRLIKHFDFIKDKEV